MGKHEIASGRKKPFITVFFPKHKYFIVFRIYKYHVFIKMEEIKVTQNGQKIPQFPPKMGFQPVNINYVINKI